MEKKGRRGRKIFNRKFFYHREFEEISGEDRYRDIVRRPRQNLVADEVLCFFFCVRVPVRVVEAGPCLARCYPTRCAKEGTN